MSQRTKNKLDPKRASRFVDKNSDLIVRTAEGKPVRGFRSEPPKAKRGAAPRRRDRLGLATLRRDRELSQEQIAERLGVKQSHISRLEAREDVRVSNLARYLKALGATNVELDITYENGKHATFPLQP